MEVRTKRPVTRWLPFVKPKALQEIPRRPSMAYAVDVADEIRWPLRGLFGHPDHATPRMSTTPEDEFFGLPEPDDGQIFIAAGQGLAEALKQFFCGRCLQDCDPESIREVTLDLVTRAREENLDPADLTTEEWADLYTICLAEAHEREALNALAPSEPLDADGDDLVLPTQHGQNRLCVGRQKERLPFPDSQRTRRQLDRLRTSNHIPITMRSL